MNAALLQLADTLGGPIFGLDTSTAQASLVLVHPASGVVHERALEAATLPSEGVVAGMAEMLQAVGSRAHDLRALVVGLGPGSFTGLRVGLATAKGLALGANISIYGVSSLELLACEAGPGPVLVACDARRGGLYAALYDVDQNGACRPVLAEQVVTLASLTRAVSHALGELDAQALANVVVVGDARDKVAEAWGAQARDVPLRIAHGVLSAQDRIRAARPDDLATLVPHYLRTSSVGR